MKFFSTALYRCLLLILLQAASLPVFSQLILDARVEEEYPDFVDVKFLAYNFEDLVSMQFVFAFDPMQAGFSAFTEFNLPGLDGTAVNFLPPDRIVVSWIAPNILTGQDFPAGASMMTVRFVPIVPGGCSFFFDLDSPVIPEFVNAGSQALDYVLIDCTNSGGVLSGKVFSDNDGDCALTAGEKTLANFLVRVSDNDKDYYTVSDAAGNYFYPMDWDDQTLVLSVIPPNEQWAFCTVFDEVEITSPNIGQQRDLPMTPLLECEELGIELAAENLRPCSNSVYTVSYCNRGTLPVPGAEAVLEIDPLLEVLGSSLPWSGMSGNIFTFPLGELEVGTCGSFQVFVKLDCDVVAGQAHCTKATILPIEFCDPAPEWDGSQVAVTGQCAGSEVQFEIRNIGSAPMSAATEYTVIENDLIKSVMPLPPMAAGGFMPLSFPANGSTWRVEARQTPFYPAGSRPCATVEGCDADGDGNFSLGFVQMFPQDDVAPFISIDCQENSAVFGSNNKSAYPAGYRSTHLITAEMGLDYKLRFQNTGTDTVQTVVIRDTLSGLLDPASFRFQGSSHPCEIQIFGDRVLVFTFSDTQLPDSSANEPASRGFVQFSIDQMPGNPLGEVIENRAAIFFDFNVPVVTNQVFHTIGEDFVGTIDGVFDRGLAAKRLLVSPNPAGGQVRVRLEGSEGVKGQLRVYDQAGRLVEGMVWSGTEIFVSAGQLTYRGILRLVLVSEGKVVGMGEVVAE